MMASLLPDCPQTHLFGHTKIITLHRTAEQHTEE